MVLKLWVFILSLTLDILYTITKWQPRRLATLWASTACYKDSVTFYIHIKFISHTLCKVRWDHLNDSWNIVTGVNPSLTKTDVSHYTTAGDEEKVSSPLQHFEALSNENPNLVIVVTRRAYRHGNKWWQITYVIQIINKYVSIENINLYDILFVFNHRF
jgi:hypothetical protein